MAGETNGWLWQRRGHDMMTAEQPDLIDKMPAQLFATYAKRCQRIERPPTQKAAADRIAGFAIPFENERPRATDRKADCCG